MIPPPNGRPSRSSSKDGLGHGDGRRWESFAKKHGYQVVASGEYAPGAKDFSDLILKANGRRGRGVRAADPTRRHDIVKQMKELDFNPKMNLFIRAADPPCGRRTWARTAITSCCPGWHFAAKYPGVTELNDAHQKVQPPRRPVVGPPTPAYRSSPRRSLARNAWTATKSVTPSPPQR